MLWQLIMMEIYFDACSYAATAALLTSKTPTWEMVDDQPTVVEGGEKQLPVSTIPVSVTMGKIGNHVIVDPNGDEWASMDCRITITTDSDGTHLLHYKKVVVMDLLKMKLMNVVIYLLKLVQRLENN